MNKGINEKILLVIIYISIVIFAFILYIISKNSLTKISRDWRSNKLIDHQEFKFFLEKASAYRRLFIYFTFLSYFLKAVSIPTTFLVVYYLITDTFYTKILLVLSATFDAVSLLFPFQNYIDLFAQCSIWMEEGILKGGIALACPKEAIEDNIKSTIYTDLLDTYIKCEKLLHVENKI